MLRDQASHQTNPKLKVCLFAPPEEEHLHIRWPNATQFREDIYKSSANKVMYNESSQHGENSCCNLYTKLLPWTSATHVFEFCHGTGLVNL